MVETFCNSGQVKLKAGSNAKVLTAAEYTSIINQAEAHINVVAKIPDYNLVDNFSSLDSTVQGLLEDAASSHAAMVVICSDMNAFPSQREAETLLDFNNDRIARAITLLKEKPHTDFMRKQ